MKVLGIQSSPNKNGKCAAMLDESLAAAQKLGAQIDRIDLADFDIKPYHGFYDKEPDVQCMSIFQAMLDADALIFCTPVHWQGTSSLLKLLIDNMTFLEEKGLLRGKVYGLLAQYNEDGGFHVLSELSGIFNHMGMILPPFCTVFRNSKIQRDEVTEWQFEDTYIVSKNLLLMLDALKGKNINWDYDKKPDKPNTYWKGVEA